MLQGLLRPSAHAIRHADTRLARAMHQPSCPSCPHGLQAYDTLTDEGARMKYNAKLEQALQDEEDDYTGEHVCV